MKASLFVILSFIRCVSHEPWTVVRGWLLRRRLQKCKQEAGTDFAATEAGELEEDPDGYFVQVSAEDEASSVEVDDELLLELPGISSSSSSPTHTSRPSEMGVYTPSSQPYMSSGLFVIAFQRRTLLTVASYCPSMVVATLLVNSC